MTTTVIPPRPFTARGERAEWQLLYESLLESADFGQTITYAELSAVLGRPFCRQRGPLYRARRELGTQRHRWLVAVPRIGYRVIEAREHVRVASDHKERARRQYDQMVRVGQATDLAALSPAELMDWDKQTRINATLAAIAMAHEQRLARIEAALQQHEERIETVELLGGTRRG